MIDLKTLSFEEKEAIEELRTRVENELDDKLLEDETLFYRFLKARDFNVDKAEKMLRKHILWRKAKQVNTILEDFVPKEVFSKCLQPSIIGMDKMGDLVVYSPFGKFEGADIMTCVIFNNYIDHWAWFSERNLAKFKEMSKKLEISVRTYAQVVIIIDLEDLTFSNSTNKSSIEILLGLMNLLQDNYPEGMKAMYVINAPRYYVFGFSILKTMMSNEMIQKISVFGHEGWKEFLLKNIDADVLPAFLGGNRTDPDGNPLCKTFVYPGGKLPTCYTLTDKDRYFKDHTQIKTIHIPHNGRKEVEVDVTEVGSVIEWEFLVKNKDIGIALYHEKSEVTEILPLLIYNTFDGITSCSYKTKETGKYILVFDNSFSWMSSKEVEYTVKVIKPIN